MLFEDDDLALADASALNRKSFVEYLQTTPAEPLSMGVKAALCAVGVVVLLLLVAALLTGGR